MSSNAPQIYVAKLETPEGQSQKYLFYRLVDATDKAGHPVQVRQPVAQSTKELLDKDLVTVQSYLDLVAAMPAE